MLHKLPLQIRRPASRCGLLRTTELARSRAGLRFIFNLWASDRVAVCLSLPFNSAVFTAWFTSCVQVWALWPRGSRRLRFRYRSICTIKSNLLPNMAGGALILLVRHLLQDFATIVEIEGYAGGRSPYSHSLKGYVEE